MEASTDSNDLYLFQGLLRFEEIGNNMIGIDSTATVVEAERATKLFVFVEPHLLNQFYAAPRNRREIHHFARRTSSVRSLMFRTLFLSFVFIAGLWLGRFLTLRQFRYESRYYFT